MQIGLDIRMINYSGIGSTVRGLLDNLEKDQLEKLVLFGEKNYQNSYPIRFEKVPYPIYTLTQHWGYSKILKAFNLSFFHMPHFDVPLRYDRPFAATVHDLIHILFPQYSTKFFAKTYAQILLRHVAGKARRIFTVSENTKKDLLRLFPKSKGKIKVIYPGVGDEFKPIDEKMATSTLKKYGLEPGYFLYVGNLRPSKNTLGLIDAYLKFKRQNPVGPPLILVGKNFLKPFARGSFPPGITHIGETERKDLPALYSQASLFVFPSYYEGFGLPPIEAMACGAPCLVSNAGSLPEVCADSAEYVNPHVESELPRKLEMLFKDSSRLKDLKNKGLANARKFSWKKFAAETWGEYLKIDGEIRGAI